MATEFLVFEISNFIKNKLMLSESRKSILKFEDMLKTNTNYYFDSTEFINIIHHYIDVSLIHI